VEVILRFFDFMFSLFKEDEVEKEESNELLVPKREY
jgi:hypothetical protein